MKDRPINLNAATVYWAPNQVDPSCKTSAQVYCGDRASTANAAGEMVIAIEASGWAADNIVGGLPERCANACLKPAFDRPAHFRSIGLEREDVAVGHAVFRNAAS